MVTKDEVKRVKEVHDNYGYTIEVGTYVAFNQAGNVMRGHVVELKWPKSHTVNILFNSAFGNHRYTQYPYIMIQEDRSRKVSKVRYPTSVCVIKPVEHIPDYVE
jgi:hypothetical protein